MKIKKLTTSVALATLLGSGLAVAAADQGNSLQFGGFFIMNKFWSDTETDESSYGLDAGNWVVTDIDRDSSESISKNFDDFGLWFSRRLDENFNMYAELEGASRTDDLDIEQAWVETDYFGNWATVRMGQQRINFDGDQNRRRFDDIALGHTSIFAMALNGGLSIAGASAISIDNNMLGINIRGTDGNAFYNVGIYDDPAGGITETTNNNIINGTVVPDVDRSDFEREVSHVVVVRGGYKFGEQDDDWQAQGALAFFTAEGTETENTTTTVNVGANNTTTSRSDSENTADGFGLELYGTWGAPNMAAEFTYFSAELDDKFNGSTTNTNPSSSTRSIVNENWELDGWSFLIAWASAGAYEMAAGGAPILNLSGNGGIIWEAYVRAYDYTVDLDENDTDFTNGTVTGRDRDTHENEFDGFAIGGTAYIGKHISVGAEYGMGDYMFSDTFLQIEPALAAPFDVAQPDTKVDSENDFFELQLQVRF